jgi:hypothetical protein
MSDTAGLPPPPPRHQRWAAPAQEMAGFWGKSANGDGEPAAEPLEPEAANQGGTGTARPPATETIGRRAGTLSDELDFPEFVSSLIHGTWDAMVDSSIRQMDKFADLVAAISKPLAQFRDENVSVNQAYDWLVSQHPADLALTRDPSGHALVPKAGVDEFGGAPSPDWLAEYGLDGQPLSAELIEEQLVPAARDRLAQDRMQTLATLVMLGMNRIVVRDGSITARLRFRAAATDRASVDYAVSDDPTATSSRSWSTRGSATYAAPVTKVSTVGINAQTDSSLNAELFGEVKINFASETIPLERFADDARRVLVDRAARPLRSAVGAPSTPAAAPAVQTPPAPVAVPAPAPAAPAAPPARVP